MNIEWSLIIANLVNRYFKCPYKDANDKLIMTTDYEKLIIYRPNHGLAHGLRQGFLAVDIVLTLKSIKNKNIPIVCWIKEQLKTPYFLHKIQLVASYQRTGRQSEVSKKENIELYKSYILQDVKNFENDLLYFYGVFLNENEFLWYKNSLLWSIDNKISNADLYYLRCILSAAHILDLRRINSFDIDRIKFNVFKTLFNINSSILNYNIFIDLMHEYFIDEIRVMTKLWNTSGKYLRITGDRDVVIQRQYQERFVSLSLNPSLLVNCLCKNFINSHFNYSVFSF